MDAISGYGQFRQLSKDEVSIRLRDLKGQMQQVAKLEDMFENNPPLKTGVERRLPSEEERKLIRLVNKSKNEFQIPSTDSLTQLQSSLDTMKRRMTNQIADYERKLAEKDYSKRPARRVVQMDPAAIKLSHEAFKAKQDWHIAMMKDQLAKQSRFEKGVRYTKEVLNTQRAIMTSMDLSAVLRQGGFIALGRPITAAKALPSMFKAMRSEAGQHGVMQEIKGRDNFPVYMRSKLFLSEHQTKLSNMEEAFMSRWVEKIPTLFGGGLVRASQRAYVTFLNRLRADTFDLLAGNLARSKELTQLEGEAIANYVNVATGRGKFGIQNDRALSGLATLFFAPRYVASRFQLLAGQPLYRGNARTRSLIAKEYARTLAGIATIYALASLDPDATIETDSNSSDFGKIRYGNTRIDLMFGLLQTTVLLSREISGQTKQIKSGKVVDIRGEKVPFSGATGASVLGNFARSKLAPIPGFAVNALTGKDVVGNPFTLESQAMNLLVPLSLQDILPAMIEQGIPRGTALGILSIFGAGLQNFDEKKRRGVPSRF
ncbi:MAG: hypothetical protein E4G90_11220 [Gemmatimonadales bacterium]|nr:MAG: hypothetical protein E4G90_11220 [Gemmatimonadales bacterium]